MAKEEKKSSTGVKIATAIILLILFIGIPVAIAWWMHIHTQEMLDKGCTASAASNWLGTPTYWNCPDPKETQKFIDRGCTRIDRDETGTTWSCPVE